MATNQASDSAAAAVGPSDMDSFTHIRSFGGSRDISECIGQNQINPFSVVLISEIRRN
jgi:hypothetical protein